MSYCRPAGLSDEDDDDNDDFEVCNEDERDYNCSNKAYLESKVESKESGFLIALANGEIETMKGILANNFVIDQPLSGGWSPLMHACSLGSFPVVEFLLGVGANVNFNKELFTSLMALCKSNSTNEDELVNCFEVLLKHGANINATDRHSCTALMYACSSGHVELVKRLVDCKCDLNIQDTEGWSALFFAVSERREDIIHILIDGKARLDLIDRRRRSAYELALQKGFEELGKLVCSKKEKRRLLENEENLTVLEEKSKDQVEELLGQLPGINAKNVSGFSSDVSKLLWAMGLKHFSKQFRVNKVQLTELLLITDDRLKELGVRFSVHRQRILNSLRQFHLHRWNKASLGMKPRNQQLDVEDGVRLLCNVTKHLHVLNATMNYVRIHQPIPIQPEVFKMCENAVHQLNLISGELSALNSFASRLKVNERIEPVDLIKPKQQDRNYYVPILATTVFFGFVLWKTKILVYVT